MSGLPESGFVNRERILWLVLAVLAIGFLPPYLIERIHPGLLYPVYNKAVPADAASALAGLPSGLSDEEKYQRLFQAGKDFAKANKRIEAIASFGAAEQVALQLTDNKDKSLRDARDWLASQYEVIQHYSDTEAVYNRMLDSLRESAEDSDIAFGDLYSRLSMIQGRQGDWPAMEESSRQAIDAFEKTIRHFQGMDDPSHAMQSAQFGKAMALFRLADACDQEGKMDFAVYDADQAFRYGTEVKVADSQLKIFAELGMRVANKAEDRDAIITWQARLAKLRNVPDGRSSGVTVVQLPPRH